MDYILLKIQDKVKVNGESTLKGFEKCIEVMSYSHGVSNPMQWSTSNNGRTTGRPHIQELTVSKPLDETTPSLNQYCVLAKNLGTTELHLVRQDATGDKKLTNAVDYMVYTMTETMISSVSVGGGGGIPMETLSLNFDKISWTYVKQSDQTGAQGNASTSWEQSTNTPGGGGATQAG